MKTTWKTIALATLVVAGLSGCDDLTGPGGEEAARATVAFRTARASSVASAKGAEGARSPSSVARSVTVEGSNGTLVLEEMHLIVAEFELERAMDDDCAEDDDACEKFEAPPAFVQLPLEDGSEVAVTSEVEPDTYDELEFEVEDLDDDEEADGPSTAELMEGIREQFPDWPKDASLLVTGTFTPDGGSPVPFRVYFEAEVEIELELSPPVVVAAGEAPTFTVELDPQIWFRDGTGGVRNLALLDFDETGQVAELEVEVEDGFTGVEFGD